MLATDYLTPLRGFARKATLDSIIEGRFAPGSRLRDQVIAEELQISRTPVREALASLSDEGFVESLPNKGYRVPLLTRREPRELYPLIWTLEIHSLEVIAAFPSDRLSELRRLNKEFSSTEEPLNRIGLDDEWHRTLLGECPNAHLHRLLMNLKTKARRYEVRFLAEDALFSVSISQHERVVDCLEEGDRPGAANELKSNWETTLNQLLERIPEAAGGPSDFRSASSERGSG